MAEIIGVIASAATLSKIVSVSSKILFLVSDAPREIGKVSEEILQLSTQLQILQELQMNLEVTQQCVQDPLNRSLEQADRSISKAQDALVKLAKRSSGARGRLRWLLLGKEEASQVFEELHHTRTALTMCLSITMLSYQISQSNAIKKIATLLDEKAITHPTLLSHNTEAFHDLESLTPYPAREYQELPGCDANKTASSRRTLSIPLLGYVSGIITTVKEGNCTSTYGLSLLLELPFGRALVANLLVRAYSSWCPNFLIRPGTSLTVAKLVEQNSCLMLASRAGDVNIMKYLLSQRLATPFEVTLKGSTPMREAIEGGSLEAVRLLLQSGVDANGLFGVNQTSPLAWALRHRRFDIARLLLSHNACCQHVSALGWTPLFYLWYDFYLTPDAAPEAEEFVYMLAAKTDFSLLHSGVVDRYGNSIIHQATFHGSATDIGTLIRMGVSVFTPCGPLEWTAIHNAVFDGRTEIFRYLLPYYQHQSIDTPDTRGWTLLHIAASAGHEDIIKDLLKLGANWQALSSPSFSHMPEGLYGRCCTPAEVAAAQSPERRDLFLRAVASVLGNNTTSVDELEEVWSDAQEKQYNGTSFQV